jgi:hypothetical protein
MATTTIADPDDNDPEGTDPAGLPREAAEIFRRMNPAVFDDPLITDEDGFFRRRARRSFTNSTSPRTCGSATGADTITR